MKLSKIDQALLDFVMLYGIDGEIEYLNTEKETELIDVLCIYLRGNVEYLTFTVEGHKLNQRAIDRLNQLQEILK